MVREGLTLVVSPLIALMRDQVAQLRELGVEAAASIPRPSPTSAAASRGACEEGTLRLLYIAPGAAPARRRDRVSEGISDRLPRHRRGALRLAMGPRLPPGISAPARGRGRAGRLADHRRHRDRRRADAGRDRRQALRRAAANLRPLVRPAEPLPRDAAEDQRHPPAPRTARGPSRRMRHHLLRLAPPHRGAGRRSSRATAGGRCPITPGSTTPCARRTRTPSCARTAASSARPSPSAWASTSRTCASSSTPTCRPRSRPTTRRSAAPDATACPPTRSPSTARATSNCGAARSPTSGAPEERKRVEMAKLDDLVTLCETARCRRQTLLAMFGEESGPCGHCDVCQGAVRLIDGRHRGAEGAVGGSAHVGPVLLRPSRQYPRRQDDRSDRAARARPAEDLRRRQGPRARRLARRAEAVAVGQADRARRARTATGWSSPRRAGACCAARRRSRCARTCSTPRPRRVRAPDRRARRRGRGAARGAQGPARRDRGGAEAAGLCHLPRPDADRDGEGAAARRSTISPSIHGVGAVKLQKYGAAFLAVIRDHAQ